jgi:DNA polymerase I-like protein with 3'-5' exonuclease and polymerase domains
LGRHTFVRTPDPIYVETKKEADKWVARYIECDAVSFDTETTGLDKTRARVKFFSFSDGTSRICAPVRLLDLFAPILEDRDIEKRMTNQKFDMHMVANHGILVRGRITDTVTMDWLLDENRKGRHGLKQCASDYLGLRMASFTEVFGSVGAVEKEVEMVTRFHDILEAKDSDAAAEALALVGRADGDEEVLDSVKKISLSKQGNFSMDARKVLAQARLHGIADKTGGTLGYVADYLKMLTGIDLPSKELRQKYEHLLENRDLLEEAHELVLKQLRKKMKIDIEPLEMLRLLVSDYASLDAWGSYVLTDTLTDMLSEIQMRLDQNGDVVSLADYYADTSCPFSRVLWDMERRGFSIDLDLVDNYRRPMAVSIGKLEREFVALVGADVNMKSPKQLQEILQEGQERRLDRPVWRSSGSLDQGWCRGRKNSLYRQRGNF